MSLPTQPFDGQIFIDAFRRRWIFDGSTHCWRKDGVVSDIPVATEFQPGLLTAEFKRLIDGIPEKGGHFGIVAKPLLSLVPNDPSIIYTDKIRKAITVESGTKIQPMLINGRKLVPDTFNGKVLIFTSGMLKKKAFLVFSNSDSEIFLEGDATESFKNDSFQIADMAELNPSGIILGDIVLISDSIDISCVDGNGVELVNNASCGVSIIQCDNVDNPPGLDFKINQNFLDNLCVVIPGYKGAKGNRGEQGDKGLAGTGDGPQGDQGDPGIDGSVVGSELSSIEIIDIDDIFDTAIVSAELDADAGVLNIIRAKVRTPDNDVPATQVISTPIDRSIVFNDDSSFEFELMMPSTDPIGEADIDILKYPRQFSRGQSGQTTNVNKVKLSGFIDKIIDVFEGKLSDINDNYNKQIKQFIGGKDEAARTILANLAQEVAACEWELPLDFCLGISPDDCHPNSSDGAASGYNNQPFVFPYSSMLFGTAGGETAEDLGIYTVNASSDSIIDITAKNTFTSIMFPDNVSSVGSATLPPGGYVIQYISGSIKSSVTDWVVGVDSPGLGLVINASGTDGFPAGMADFINMPIPTVTFNAKEKSSVELAYSEAPITEKSVSVEITDPAGGLLSITAKLLGIQPQGEIKVRVFKVDTTA